jgi:hypothetical protein
VSYSGEHAIRAMKMNHYEELGVASDARAEEIRQAYKTLVRLLHPDGQTDERLKAMAERQLQRLNGILEILLDPRRRREYDEGLKGPRTAVGAWRRDLPGGLEGSGEPVVPQWTDWVQWAVRYWIWVLVGTTCVGTAAVWWAMAPERSATAVLPAAAAQVQAHAAEAAVPREARIANRGGRVRQRAREVQDTPVPAAETATGAQGESAAIPEPGISAGVEMRAAVRPAPAAEASAAEPAAQPNPKAEEWRFAGNWLYVPQAQEASGMGYPAEYVELLLTEDNGTLAGRYRAKHRVSDRAVPGEVDLRLRGAAPSGKKGRAEWTSGSGAKGVMEMTLRGPGLMSVAWWATELGRGDELSSGSAVLVWQQP